jgi:hypothetical protein
LVPSKRCCLVPPISAMLRDLSIPFRGLESMGQAYET